MELKFSVGSVTKTVGTIERPKELSADVCQIKTSSQREGDLKSARVHFALEVTGGVILLNIHTNSI